MANHGKDSHSFAHDAFISFRGEDIRHTFIKDLREELYRMGFKIFIDDDDRDMRIGEGIKSALSKAMEESEIAIVVLSKNYATSTWCLNELVEILDLRNRNNKHVIPIFYDVDPLDVRYQRNSYSDAKTVISDDRFREDHAQVQTWKSALSEIGGLDGHHIIAAGSKINFIEKIVEEVRAHTTRKPLPVSEDLVGLEHHIEAVKSLLDLNMKPDSVCLLGIYGLGGVGKTELVKALYNKIRHQFDTASFLENVGEKYKKFNGLENLKKILLSEVREKVETPSQGTNINKKVLLVLDNIDDREQLNNLAGGCDWFGSSSRIIIITTRDQNLLRSHPIKIKMYRMTELPNQHSLQLFCQNAFGKRHPKPGFEDMSSRVVGYAQGIPLALKVIGSNLASLKSLEAWERALNVYESIPHSNIQDKLKVSYDGLKKQAQQVFLDIACFFKGERKKYIEKILKQFNARNNIRVLVSKSLITIENGCLKMHDLIQDMGKEIVRQESPNVGNRSRLWSYEDVLEVLTEDSGNHSIEGIMLDPPQRKEVNWSGIAFKKMECLRILIIRNTSFSLGPKHMPNNLRLLDWEEYPSKSFPIDFHPKDIIVLNLCRNNLTLEEPFKEFSSLIIMNFSSGQSITVMPDVSKVPNLRELRLNNCKKLLQVHESIGILKSLTHLSTSGCSELRHFPQSIFLPSLEVLNLNFCIRLEYFPNIVKKMNNRLKIYMIDTAIKELPNSISNLNGLVCIEITGSNELRYLPSSLFMLPNVVAFKIGGCHYLQESFKSFLESHSTTNRSPTLRTLSFVKGGLSDKDFCTVLNCFPKLEELIVSQNNFESVPECIKESIHLTSLDVSSCMMLRKIPECTKLRILDVHQCEQLRHISELPSTIKKVDARCCISLTRKTFTMLWSQVQKEIRKLEIVMPYIEIPKWFDFADYGENPRFWVRKKLPTFALALVFQDVKGVARRYRRQLVELELVINGQRVPCKGYYSFKIAPSHVLVCDLRLLFSNEQQRHLDAFLQCDWNVVQVSYNSKMMLSCWGVFVYKKGTNMKDVQFECPDPMYSYIANTSQTKMVPKEILSQSEGGR